MVLKRCDRGGGQRQYRQTCKRRFERRCSGCESNGYAVFLLSANIFYILLWKKERKGAIITHISASDAFCADISHYDRYNRAVMLSPLFARSGSIQPFSLPCISRLCDFSDTLKISDIFNVFRNNSRIHIKVILRRSCMSVESHSPKGSNLCQMYARGVVYRHFR